MYLQHADKLSTVSCRDVMNSPQLQHTGSSQSTLEIGLQIITVSVRADQRGKKGFRHAEEETIPLWIGGQGGQGQGDSF